MFLNLRGESKLIFPVVVEQNLQFEKSQFPLQAHFCMLHVNFSWTSFDFRGEGGGVCNPPFLKVGQTNKGTISVLPGNCYKTMTNLWVKGLTKNNLFCRSSRMQ